MAKSTSVLVTGAAGFIGFHTAKRLLDEGYKVVGVDSVNDYYDVQLKKDRVAVLKDYTSFTFYKQDLVDRQALVEVFEKHQFSRVVNLAAQAGVRHSIDHPEEYIDSNVFGFLNVLEACRHFKVSHLLYASSSSVYGANTSMPFKVSQNVDHPLSLYAATKKSNELMAHAYASMYNLPVTGLRFFSAYGPWGRPDMALFIFTKNIIEGKPIDVYNHGKMKRDFTYIDDIVDGIYRLLDYIPTAKKEWNSNNPDPAVSFAPYNLFNIGNNNPIRLTDFIETIEEKLESKAIKNSLGMQIADVPTNYADISALQNAVGYQPKTKLKEGVDKFIDWYREYYQID